MIPKGLFFICEIVSGNTKNVILVKNIAILLVKPNPIPAVYTIKAMIDIIDNKRVIPISKNFLFNTTILINSKKPSIAGIFQLAPS